MDAAGRRIFEGEGEIGGGGDRQRGGSAQRRDLGDLKGDGEGPKEHQLGVGNEGGKLRHEENERRNGARNTNSNPAGGTRAAHI